jgi:hypothetical protein
MPGIPGNPYPGHPLFPRGPVGPVGPVSSIALELENDVMFFNGGENKNDFQNVHFEKG